MYSMFYKKYPANADNIGGSHWPYLSLHVLGGQEIDKSFKLARIQLSAFINYLCTVYCIV